MDGNGGGGRAILMVVVGLAVIIGAALLVGKLAEYNDAEASRLYARGALEESYGRAQGEIIRAQSQGRLDQAIAEAQMVLAQGQARLDSAQAFAVTAGASLPWLVAALVGIAGIVLMLAIVAIFSLALAALSGRMQQPPYFPQSRRWLPRQPQVVIEQPGRAALPEPEGSFVQAFILDEEELEIRD